MKEMKERVFIVEEKELIKALELPQGGHVGAIELLDDNSVRVILVGEKK